MANPSNSNITASDIQKLLDELYFVPVWRSDDEVIQPVVGTPFSPKSPPVCPMVKTYNLLLFVNLYVARESFRGVISRPLLRNLCFASRKCTEALDYQFYVFGRFQPWA